jgi:hypothetical protein
VISLHYIIRFTTTDAPQCPLSIGYNGKYIESIGYNDKYIEESAQTKIPWVTN